MHIHQVVVSAVPGDAVTSSAFEVRELLRQIGPSDIFAMNIDPRLGEEVVHLDAFPRPSATSGNDILIFHASIGSPDVFAFLSQRPERLVMMYHNISPASAFEPYEPGFARLLTLGRQELVALRSRVVLALAPSAFNASELIELGYPDVRVSPLIVDIHRMRSLLGQDGDGDGDGESSDAESPPTFLFVGQQLPHKRPDFLLQAFHLLTTHILSGCKLILVGPIRLRHYGEMLFQLKKELNLENAVITGAVPELELAQHYRNASVFVTASEHEGFCVPLLEAMAFDVPVLARSFAAIPGTVGDAGLLLPPDAGPALMAEAMATMAEDAAIRDACTERGRDRLRAFGSDDARSIFLGHLLDVV